MTNPTMELMTVFDREADILTDLGRAWQEYKDIKKRDAARVTALEAVAEAARVACKTNELYFFRTHATRQLITKLKKLDAAKGVG